MPGVRGLEYAATKGIANTVINHKKFDNRDAFEEALHKTLIFAGVDFICLAGFMRILGDEFVDKWTDRIINIHPSLLPSFKGLHTHVRALEAGVRFAGCTIHFVRPAVDEGPIILQAVVPILPNDSSESLEARVLQQEHIIYPSAVRMVAEGRVRVRGKKVRIMDTGIPSAPIINPPDKNSAD